MANGLSSSIKNGQTFGMNAGRAAIAQQALVQAGGPGNEAWPVMTSDFAAQAAPFTVAPANVIAEAVNNYMSWPQAQDALGNTYVLTPNASSQGVVATKYSPTGAQLAQQTIDATTAAMSSLRLLALSNGYFAATYVNNATGGVKFSIFDAQLDLVVSPAAVATGALFGSTAYVDSCLLPSGAGFAIVYQNSAKTALMLQTYTNAGAAGLAATSIQALGGTAALAYMRMGVASTTGNLIVAMRTTATPAGTSFVIVNPTTGANVVANTVMDSTATAGFCFLSIMNGGGFCLVDANGTNLKAAVYSDAGAQQGSTFTGATTLNSSTFRQVEISSGDGVNFWLAYILSAGGLQMVQLGTNGTASGMNPAAIATGTFTTTTAIGMAVANNVAFMLAASSATGGQSYAEIGLADATLGISEAYLIGNPTSIGAAAGTTGAYWPSVRSVGDFTATLLFDHQSTAAIIFSIVKWAASSIQGVACAAVAAGSQGTVNINPGPGSYPTTGQNGTSGLAFDHSQAAIPGNRGTVFAAGAQLSAPATQSAGGPSPTGLITTVGASGSYTYTATANVLLTITAGYTGAGTGATLTVNGASFFLSNSSANPQPTYGPIQIALAAGQSISVSTSSTAVAILSAQKIN